MNNCLTCLWAAMQGHNINYQWTTQLKTVPFWLPERAGYLISMTDSGTMQSILNESGECGAWEGKK